MRKTISYNKMEEGYAEIRLDRPGKHNAVSIEMAKELQETLENARQETIKFLVITGVGDKMFCTGGDLKELHGGLSTDEAFSILHPMKKVLYELVSFPCTGYPPA
ncbi:enoyl-CoA hydratase/isomerase family protein [Virgibacillus sediminis]|uniref:Enoyl-CoA hydratase/isomerase family protein n=1 Tax=Virgibacillus sediminis TaxID=202260 RepID=A0ABV7ABY7_9BACI